jgi:hypothetical protein
MLRIETRGDLFAAAFGHSGSDPFGRAAQIDGSAPGAAVVGNDLQRIPHTGQHRESGAQRFMTSDDVGDRSCDPGLVVTDDLKDALHAGARSGALTKGRPQQTLLRRAGKSLDGDV